MKNAIIILVHKLPEQVNMFVEQILASTDMDIYIHINRKYDYLRTQFIQNDRIIISDNNISIKWGSDDILKAIIIMMREIRDSGILYGHILINTGQDLLIKKGLDLFLKEHPQEIFFEACEQDKKRRAFLLHYWPDKYRQLIDFKLNPLKVLRRFRIELFTLGLPMCKKKINYNTNDIVFYRNWFWGALPMVAANYVLDFIEENHDFLSIYKNALVPEEGFMVTVLMRSPYKKWINFNNTGHSRSLTKVIKRLNGHPVEVLSKDIEELDNSEFYFSRKFDVRVDRNVVEHYYKKICN